MRPNRSSSSHTLNNSKHIILTMGASPLGEAKPDRLSSIMMRHLSNATILLGLASCTMLCYFPLLWVLYSICRWPSKPKGFLSATIMFQPV